MKIHELGDITPGSAFYLVGRLKNRAGSWAAPGDFSAVNVRVDNETTNTLVAAVTADVDEVLVALTVDGRWKRDKIGYNFAYPVPSAHVAAAQTSYLLKFELVAEDGTKSYAYARVKTLKPEFTSPA